MSAKGETIRVRIAPGFRAWQALVVALALAVTLLLGVAVGRSTGSDVETAPISFAVHDTGPGAHASGMRHPALPGAAQQYGP
jgi:hypothetical protein